MSQETNELLHLFSKVLSNPNMMFALRAEKISKQMKNRGNRNGAQGLLVELWEKDGLTNAEIAELLDIRPSSVTAQVKNLEEAGFIERVTDENDKRVSRIFLTEKGRTANTERREFHDDMSENIFGSLTDEEQAQLKSILLKLEENQKDFDVRDFVDNWQDIQKMNSKVMRDMHKMHRDMTKEMSDHLREAWNARNDGDHNPFSFRDGMRQLREMNRAGNPGHNPWNFGQNGGPADEEAYFDKKRKDFRSQPFKDSKKADKDQPDNWDDF